MCLVTVPDMFSLLISEFIVAFLFLLVAVCAHARFSSLYSVEIIQAIRFNLTYLKLEEQ